MGARRRAFKKAKRVKPIPQPSEYKAPRAPTPRPAPEEEIEFRD